MELKSLQIEFTFCLEGDEGEEKLLEFNSEASTATDSDPLHTVGVSAGAAAAVKKQQPPTERHIFESMLLDAQYPCLAVGWLDIAQLKFSVLLLYSWYTFAVGSVPAPKNNAHTQNGSVTAAS